MTTTNARSERELLERTDARFKRRERELLRRTEHIHELLVLFMNVSGDTTGLVPVEESEPPRPPR